MLTTFQFELYVLFFLSDLELWILPEAAVFISGQISLSIWQNSWVLNRVGQTTALHLTYAYQEDQSCAKVRLRLILCLVGIQ